jgi:hypothetical protein
MKIQIIVDVKVPKEMDFPAGRATIMALVEKQIFGIQDDPDDSQEIKLISINEIE